MYAIRNILSLFFKRNETIRQLETWLTALNNETCERGSDRRVFWFPTAALRFVVLGDWGGIPVPPYYTPHEEAVAAEVDSLARTEGVDFVLSLGDHFYFNGVKNVEDLRFKVSWQSKHTGRETHVWLIKLTLYCSVLLILVRSGWLRPAHRIVLL